MTTTLDHTLIRHVAAVLGVALSPEDLALAESTHGECGLDAIEAAAIVRAVERHPMRPDEGRCPTGPHEASRPDAGTRHALAGALVWALLGAGGYRYGSVPLLPLGAGPIEPDRDAELAHAAACAAARAAGRVPPPQRGRYEVAEGVCLAYLGRLDAGGPRDRPPVSVALQRALADLAIDLLCDESRSVAEITLGAMRWLALEHPGAWVAYRLRCMALAAAGEWEPR